ncbi:MAG: AMP-binding protein [Prolixibacteraceae bacterium]|nr:AMP-binding protein [Prolixibacteraceae bacterium]
MADFLKKILANFEKFSGRTAFVIEGGHCSYAQLGQRVAAFQKIISEKTGEQYFGVVAHNHIDTYAAIFALWFSGKTSVPVSGASPPSRLNEIFNMAGVQTAFDAEDNNIETDTDIVSSSQVHSVNDKPVLALVDGSTDLYVLFTSGSTGHPKGVRISRANLDAYFMALSEQPYSLNETDRFLDIYEPTFDASVQCYVWALLFGASVYTLPTAGVTYINMMKLLMENDITFVKMTPSAISYLKPYFERIHLPQVRYSLFGAEGLPGKLASDWQQCVPNAQIVNVYGPTEATVNCTSYFFDATRKNKSHNGILSIGKPYPGVVFLICDAAQNEVEKGYTGELCVAGAQVTKGYLSNEEMNRQVFFERTIGDKQYRFYRTGDRMMEDVDGDLLFVGRTDAQVKINGHRVELGEVEHHASVATGEKTVALPLTNGNVHTGIVVFVESAGIDKKKLINDMRVHVPIYMVPQEVVCVENIPLTQNGKVNRSKLKNMIDDE